VRASSRFADGVQSLARLLRRSPRQQRLALEAAATLWAVKALTRATSFERWRHVLEPMPPASKRGGAVLGEREIAEVVWAVDQVSQRFPNALTCLPRALAVRRMLASRGVSTTLELGVARDDQGKFEAHAWVLYEGRVIIGQVPHLERYTKLPAWPGQRGSWSRA
jgi:hypothetical protein